MSELQQPGGISMEQSTHSAMVRSKTYFTELRGWWLVTPTHTLQLFQVGRHICQINCWEGSTNKNNNHDNHKRNFAAHAVVICTEWDEFSSLDYKRCFAKKRIINMSTWCWRIINTMLNAVEGCICMYKDVNMSTCYWRIYGGMAKPAFLFDGRKILDHDVRLCF